MSPNGCVTIISMAIKAEVDSTFMIKPIFTLNKGADQHEAPNGCCRNTPVKNNDKQQVT